MGKEKLKNGYEGNNPANCCVRLSGCGEFRDTDGLQDVLGLDSLAMVTLLVRLEDAFGIRLDESDMNPYELYAAQDVMRLVEKYLEKADGYPG